MTYQKAKICFWSVEGPFFQKHILTFKIKNLLFSHKTNQKALILVVHPKDIFFTIIQYAHDCTINIEIKLGEQLK